MSIIDDKPKIKIKTYTFYSKNKFDNKIFDYMSTISKNIYNCTLYCYKVYKQFEDDIYKELYDDIIKNNYIDKLTDVIKKKTFEPKIKNKDRKDLGGNKIYNCINCNKSIDRDINGCRNIYMKQYI